ncbi:hypothetical protein CDAR_230511 [Caerostris darwini]|uniref:Uncharacterized protein n=1 Tax=Caerostris darwini TaxID=1538125 RepID=A0AAV4RTQ9_9ARAC|nr:hypothetical protein CDAR_230511 [Caerostris darwini]
MHLYFPLCSFFTFCKTRDWFEMITPAEALLKKGLFSNNHVSSAIGGFARIVHSMYTSFPSLMVEYLMLAPKCSWTSGGTVENKEDDVKYCESDNFGIEYSCYQFH